MTETQIVRSPKPSVQTPDELNLRDFEFVIITPENIDEVFANIKGDTVLFAVTTQGYENIALNLSDIRALIQQQKAIIAIYDKQWD